MAIVETAWTLATDEKVWEAAGSHAANLLVDYCLTSAFKRLYSAVTSWWWQEKEELKEPPEQAARNEPQAGEGKEQAAGQEAANGNQPEPLAPELEAAGRMEDIQKTVRVVDAAWEKVEEKHQSVATRGAANDNNQPEPSVLSSGEAPAEPKSPDPASERERRENEVRERFDADHDRRGTEPEERERLRQELDQRLEEQRRGELQRQFKENSRDMLGERHREPD